MISEILTAELARRTGGAETFNQMSAVVGI